MVSFRTLGQPQMAYVGLEVVAHLTIPGGNGSAESSFLSFPSLVCLGFPQAGPRPRGNNMAVADPALLASLCPVPSTSPVVGSDLPHPAHVPAANREVGCRMGFRL